MWVRGWACVSLRLCVFVCIFGWVADRWFGVCVCVCVCTRARAHIISNNLKDLYIFSRGRWADFTVQILINGPQPGALSSST